MDRVKKLKPGDQLVGYSNGLKIMKHWIASKIQQNKQQQQSKAVYIQGRELRYIQDK